MNLASDHSAMWTGKHPLPRTLSLILSFDKENEQRKEYRLMMFTLGNLTSQGFITVWGTYEANGDFLAMSLSEEGPKRSFFLTMKAGPMSVGPFRMDLISEVPFLAVATGVLLGNETTDDKQLGTNWVGTVLEC